MKRILTNPYEDGLMTIPEKNSMGTCDLNISLPAYFRHGQRKLTTARSGLDSALGTVLQVLRCFENQTFEQHLNMNI
jgi:hypothetical protein